ncbi:peptidyl-tRNA hydrolase [Mesorhizobium sp. INR15]|uniref:peptidyl-tRNA hydrolase n=1 Tax=Mesorhizobium sp. INR15 TaxID=2654248 RepID=UPI0035BBFD1F
MAVGVRNEREFLTCVEICKEAGLIAISVKDAGHTVFDQPTYTVGAVGPCYNRDLPRRCHARLRLFEAGKHEASSRSVQTRNQVAASPEFDRGLLEVIAHGFAASAQMCGQKCSTTAAKEVPFSGRPRPWPSSE